MKIMFWNIRGMKKKATRLALGNLVRVHSPKIVCLAEPMIEVQNFPKIFFNKLGFDADLIHNEKSDKVPNLWVVWRRGMTKPHGIAFSDQHISMSAWRQNTHFVFSFVHANCFRASRRELWTNLAASNPSQGTPWLVAGDFNANFLAHEKRGPSTFNMGSAAEFGAMIDGCSLIQIPSQGRKFTWTNNRRKGNVMAKLDRSLCTDDWFSQFQDCHQKVISMGASDHLALMVVSEASLKPLNYPFWFQRSWADHENFKKIVKDSWDDWISGSALYVFSQKIKRLKVAMKEWARETFPNVNLEKEEALKGLEDIQQEIEENGMNDQAFAREVDAKTRYLKALEVYEKFWAEKARIKWRLQGNRSSKFFHVAVKVRRLKNTIRSLKAGDRLLITEKVQLEEFVKIYYQNFLKRSPTVENMDMLDCIPSVLVDIDRWRMDSLPSNEEIKRAIWDLDPESSPSPDRFPAIRLSVVMPRLISEEQGAFQKGKIIHSNITLASELADMMFSATRGGSMGVKIDIQKAYDTVALDFIFQVLRKFGFSENWISQVFQLLVSAKISILLNGGPIEYFNVERGLRQGDPISPMLFILDEEVLCRGLNKLVEEKKLKPIQGPRGVITPAHSIFADDIFIFSNASIRLKSQLISARIGKYGVLYVLALTSLGDLKALCWSSLSGGKERPKLQAVRRLGA
ncbi:uncharacterized protein LOC122092373 [Macadamia integrifolia]|uniref:uncharacterized protein LOC122092373 n=1 Tax=Macadamia integrifolia TaxID=60698 RepID=UPI001C5340F5|nr:uncharacterized protein LOC122092373 [Macadamia integrifolia]